MYRRSNFGNTVNGCLQGMPSPVESGSCVLEHSLQEGGCENDSGGPGYKYVGGRPAKYPPGTPAPPCCVSNPPKECIGTGTSGVGAGSSNGCIVPRNDEGPSYLYLNGRSAGGVDKCSNCGKYHYSDGIGCFKLKYDSGSNSCIEGDYVGDSRSPQCGGTLSGPSSGVRKSPQTASAGSMRTDGLTGTVNLNVSSNLIGASKPTVTGSTGSTVGSKVGAQQTVTARSPPPPNKGNSINPVVIALVIAAIAILLYFLLSNKKFKKSFFGKRK